jgi:hypothetical protein
VEISKFENAWLKKNLSFLLTAEEFSKAAIRKWKLRVVLPVTFILNTLQLRG